MKNTSGNLAPTNTVDELVIPKELSGDLPPLGDITQIFDPVPNNNQPNQVAPNFAQLGGVIGGLLAQNAENFAGKITAQKSNPSKKHGR